MADLNTRLVTFLDNIDEGAAQSTVTVNTTQTATAANTDETDLWTYSLPANTLSVDGKALRVTIWGTTGATANNKTLKAYFGTTLVLNQTVSTNNGRWVLELIVVRTAAATQQVLGGGQAATATFAPALTAGTEDLTTAKTIKMTGTNGSAAANDIVFRGAMVELIG